MKQVISIIVPVYNAERYLHRCIDSIIAQTFADFEVLLIDDGSTDKSGEICDEYAEKDERIKVFHKANGGVSSARNVGLDNANGEWVTFCDADDWMESDALNMYLKYTSVGEIDIVRCGYNKVCDKKIENVSCEEVHIQKSDGSIFEYIEKTTYYGFVWNSLFRRNVVGDIRFDECVNWSEDHLFSAMVDYNCRKIVFAPERLYNHLVHISGSLSDNNDCYMLINVASKEFKAKKALYDKNREIVHPLVIQIYRNFVTKAMTRAFYCMKYAEFKKFIISTTEFIVSDVNLTKPFDLMYDKSLPFAFRYLMFRLVLTFRNYKSLVK